METVSTTSKSGSLPDSAYFGHEAQGTRTVKARTRVWELRGRNQDADCFAEVCS
jgi:hypothetical protein